MGREDMLVTEIACLVGGRWATIRAGLVMLLRRGLLNTNRRGRVERVGSSPRDGEPLEKALFAGLLGWSGAREVGEKPRVRAVLRDTRRALERRGLLRPAWKRLVVPFALAVVPGVVVARLVSLGAVPPAGGVFAVVACAAAAIWFLPRRTVAGARALRRLRDEYAADVAALESGAADVAEWSPRRVGAIVALYGDAALLAIMPEARGAGLLHGGRWTRRILHSSEDYGEWTDTAMSEMNRENPVSGF
ncbi:TIGR04222 domain-containing membrane protein [Phytohabitans sp. LJ34]|uniref:TIGR04222 domain-containing membrane protein n=1 Tax=Phytohabitans sp. LJ34 TaxID=3452217 RepID=UPI003F8B9F88